LVVQVIMMVGSQPEEPAQAPQIGLLEGGVVILSLEIVLPGAQVHGLTGEVHHDWVLFPSK
jgi:hypothetical protein